MVSVKQYEDDYCLVKQNSAFELSECPRDPLSGIKFPLYCFGSLPAKGNDDSYGGTSCTVEEEQSLLDCLLLSQWEDRSWKGLLKYDVTNCETKFISGSLKFIAQLSEGWSSNCFTECVENKILLPFDPFKFNCMKTLGEELLFCVASGEKADSELITSSMVPNDGNLIILNVTPVEYGHVFIIPRDFYYLPQFLDARSLEMAAQVAIDLNNSSFRVFYDYHASSRVNHLYFQVHTIMWLNKMNERHTFQFEIMHKWDCISKVMKFVNVVWKFMNGWKLSRNVFFCPMSVNYFLSVSLVENYGMDGICLGMLSSHVAEISLQRL